MFAWIKRHFRMKIAKPVIAPQQPLQEEPFWMDIKESVEINST